MSEIAAARNSETPQDRELLDLLEGTIARVRGDTEKAMLAFDKARNRLEAALAERPDDPAIVSNLAWAYAGLGRKEDALRASQRSVELMPSWRDATEGPFYANMQAQTLAWFGDKDAALNQLTGVVKLPGGPSFGELNLDPSWDQLRGDPRFDELIDGSSASYPSRLATRERRCLFNASVSEPEHILEESRKTPDFGAINKYAWKELFKRIGSGPSAA